MQIGSPELVVATNYPNPFSTSTNFKYHVAANTHVTINIIDLSGKLVGTVVNENKETGDYTSTWNAPSGLAAGIYLATFSYDGYIFQTIKINHINN